MHFTHSMLTALCLDEAMHTHVHACTSNHVYLSQDHMYFVYARTQNPLNQDNESPKTTKHRKQRSTEEGSTED